MVKEIFVCSCHSLEHQIMFWYDEENNIFYAEVHLTGRSFLKRLVYGLKYILGHKSNYGAWDEFIFDKDDEEKLLYFLNNKDNG